MKSCFFFFVCCFFLKRIPPWPKRALAKPKKNASTKKQPLDIFPRGVFWDLSQVPITAGAPIIAAGPVEPESLSKEVGDFLKTFFFSRRFFCGPKKVLRFCVRSLEDNFC